MTNHKDYYQVLGIQRDAEQQTIKEAYRKLAFQYHPDRNEGEVAAVEKMKEINEAYAVLSDAEKRLRYDDLRHQYGSQAYDHFRRSYSEQDIFRNSDINQIFEEMAKAFGFRGFDDVFRGSYGQGYQSREFRGPGVFGRVIVFGPGHGARQRTGSAEVKGGMPGVGLIGKAMNLITRYALKKMLGHVTDGGNDIYDTITLDEHEATRGGKVVYLDEKRSRELTIAVPPGVREGQLIRLRGIGDGRENKGDLYLKVEIKRPLLKRVREFLKV
jgi:DnaJ-class molecular chaperone